MKTLNKDQSITPSTKQLLDLEDVRVITGFLPPPFTSTLEMAFFHSRKSAVVPPVGDYPTFKPISTDNAEQWKPLIPPVLMNSRYLFCSVYAADRITPTNTIAREEGVFRTDLMTDEVREMGQKLMQQYDSLAEIKAISQ
ncbi:hypothetical protein [Rodentibacter pneumotropicus]|uniref:Uncharacterized protein n=1 Tax=Rodentibacter pneumotropicus TaxID=758 RepID=A0A448MT18_9PAST|nr:hypothetical protein [Rodentibacter pneumotropicus]VEH68274.1 Uncharacterised protein [Rodentibacter pneumotropicus]